MVNGLIVQKKFFEIVLTSTLGNGKIQSKEMPSKLGKWILGGKIMNREEILEKHELLVAICYTVGVALFSAAHIYALISASAIL